MASQTKCWVFCGYKLVSSAESIRTSTSTSAAAAGAPRGPGARRGPGNLYNNVTMGAVSRLGRLVPATKGEVQDVNAEFEQYKNETTTVINALVSEINSLTPVGGLLRACVQV